MNVDSPNPSMAPRAAVALVAAFASGCHSAPGVLSPAGPGARSLAEIGWASLLAFAATTAIVWILLVVAAVRRRGTLEEHAPAEQGGGHSWILIGGIVIPALVFAALFVLTLRNMDRFPLHDDSVHQPEIRVIGRQWWWEVQYVGDSPEHLVVTANEIHVPVGQPVEIALESRDVIHSFWVPELHGKVDLVPGITNHLRIQADRPGRFEGRCAEYCGAEHALMRLLVVAEPPAGFAAWMANQSAPARAPFDPVAQAGRSVFESRGCPLCHRVRGTSAAGTVGPDLTHFGTRARLGANSLPNEHAYVMAWATRAQFFKPGVLMPNITDFKETELDSVATYLQALQ
jgi:cytochrome c oxidase subunit 2